MSAVPARSPAELAPWTWARHAELHVHCMSPWWSVIHAPRPRGRVRVVGNVAFLPPPVAGYRIRHHGGGSTVELKPSRGSAIVVCSCPTAAAARLALVAVACVHRRPFLGEFGQVPA